MNIVLIFGRQTPLLQFSISLWKSTTLNNFHDRLTLLPHLLSSIDLCKIITLHKFQDMTVTGPPSSN